MEYDFIMFVNHDVESQGRAIRWWDEYETGPDRTVLTSDELFIPGLRTFGHQLMRSAAPALPLHYHKDAFEVVLVTEGDVSFWINGVEARGMVREVHLVQPNTPHSTNNKPLTNGEIYWLQLETDVPDTLYLTQRSWETIERSEDIERATAYIRAHLRENIRLSAVADAAGLSLSYFKEKFRREMLSTPRTYINRQKIELAKQLLLESCNVTSVAEELSFDTPAYFSSVFRKFMAMTPSQYIQENIDRE